MALYPAGGAPALQPELTGYDIFSSALVVNYAQWRTREAILAARANPEVARRISEGSKIAQSFNPVLYELRQSVQAAAK